MQFGLIIVDRSEGDSPAPAGAVDNDIDSGAENCYESQLNFTSTS